MASSSSANTDSVERVQTELLSLLATSASLPRFGEDYELYASTSESFRNRTKTCAGKTEALLQKISKSTTGALEYDKLYALAADLRERAHATLDEAKGLSSATEKVQVAASRIVVRNANLNGLRPQDSFHDAPIDNSRAPFKPRLTKKPNAVVPLGELRPEVPQELPAHLAEHILALGKDDATSLGFYSNPYEHEIRIALEEKAPTWLWKEDSKFPLRVRAPASVSSSKKKHVVSQAHVSLEVIPLTYVDNEETFKDMLEHLENGTHAAIAVDLEHHSLRSFQGFTCVMQISTNDRDFVVDALAMREQLPNLLNVFTDPNIVKVLHGADSDIEWLQRDFGLYISQLFDTGQAARILGYESASLAYALDRHCKVVANKAYQLADWRLRPLTADMLKYAREDTHYLLGIFDAMRQELIKLAKQKRIDAVQKVLERSADIASKTYEKIIYSPKAHLELVKPEDTFSPAELHVLAALYEWRDAVAREEDESLEYVLSDRGLLRLAKTCPRGPEALVKELDGVKSSSIVRQRLVDVVKLIEDALNQAAAPIVAKAKVTAVEKEPVAPAAAGKKTKQSAVRTSISTTEKSSAALLEEEQSTFYLGVNGLGGVFTVPPSLSNVASSSSTTKVQVVVSKQGLFAPDQSEVEASKTLLNNVKNIRAQLSAREAQEIQARIRAVEEAEQKVEELLKGVKHQDSLNEVAKPETTKAPTSITEKFSLQTSATSTSSSRKQMAVDEEDEGFVSLSNDKSFEYTKELAIKAGAVRPPTQDESAKGNQKKKRWRDPREVETTVLRSSSSSSAAGPHKSHKRERLEETKDKKRSNPYVLKPSRQPAQSMSFTPKN